VAQTVVITLVVWMLLALLCVVVLIVLANRLHPYRSTPLHAVGDPWPAEGSRGPARSLRGPVARAPARRARSLIVVSRDHPTLHEALKRVYGDDSATDMVIDRRMSERRSLNVVTPTDRRRTDRRQNRIDEDLRTTGWALVQLQS
jgi:hypothetical protein